jgi:hypothetical protein
MESLKQIVNEIFLIDIESKSRKRGIVDGRKVYSKILRDLGYSYELIGSTINKDHATIMHYVKDIDSLFEFDNVFKKRYNLCKRKFLLEDRQIIMKSSDDIHLEAVTLAEKLEKAILDKKQIAHTFMQCLENYYEEYTSMPTIHYCRESILPLFDD